MNLELWVGSAAIAVCGLVFFFDRWLNRKKLSKPVEKKIIRFECPHSCTAIMSSTACFEGSGEFWVAEFCDNKQPEGRTYQVNYCPWCGKKAPNQIS